VNVNTSERQQLIHAYSNGFDRLSEAWDSTPGDARHWKPSVDDWSAHEIVVHCADSETYAATRIRLLTAEPNPLIVGYDQERWVSIFDYEHLSAELALATVSAVRANTHRLLLSLPETAWASTGRHTESGVYSAEDWLRTYAAHLHDHAEQIQSNVNKWGKQVESSSIR
jgi:hypothetical protein